MVLGRSRPRLRADGSRLFAVRTTPIALQSAHSWALERGSTLFSAGVDVLGGFPGYADRGCLLSAAQLRITDHYLLIDEGRPQGFGIPVTWLDGTTLIEQPGRDDVAMRVFHRAGGSSRLFTLKFRGGRVGGRGGQKSVRAQDALQRAGMVDRYAEHPPLDPEFTLPWEQTREFEHENVIWTGRASAPIRVGAESAPSEVWLTTKSLIWGSGDGDGINRIPLPLLMDLVSTRLRDRLGTPVIYVAIGDETTGRYELPFAFDLHTPPDRNFRERGAFLVGLRSRGLDDGIAAPYCQPWRASLLSIDDEARATSRLHARAALDTLDDIDPVDGDDPETEADAIEEFDATRDEPMDDTYPDVPHRHLPSLDNISHISEIFERRRAAARRARESERPPASPPASTTDRTLPPPTFLRADPVFDLEMTPGSSSAPSNPRLAAYTEIAAQAPHRDAELAESATDVPIQDAAVDDPNTDALSNRAGTEDVLVSGAGSEWSEPRQDATERFTLATSNPPDSPPSNDVVLAEWSAATESVEVDRALSETWSARRGTPDEIAAPGAADQADQRASAGVHDNHAESSADKSRSAEPPGWWPEIGASGDDVVETGMGQHDPETDLKRLVASDTVAPDTEAWPAVRAYEETAVGALSDVLRAIDARVQGNTTAGPAEHAPGSWEQARALGELTEMVHQGVLSPDDARHRRERLIALGEVCVRLRTLVELHANGILATDQLDAKRASLLDGLSATLTRSEMRQ